jgi:hypothetical protein
MKVANLNNYMLNDLSEDEEKKLLYPVSLILFHIERKISNAS